MPNIDTSPLAILVFHMENVPTAGSAYAAVDSTFQAYFVGERQWGYYYYELPFALQDAQSIANHNQSLERLSQDLLQ